MSVLFPLVLSSGGTTRHCLSPHPKSNQGLEIEHQEEKLEHRTHRVPIFVNIEHVHIKARELNNYPRALKLDYSWRAELGVGLHPS